ncbi:MAG TPA: SHOCT domain-containing protein [Ktedonobacteraceae bacterium]|nr:SHOCT domain-containing protein [Ktedonobacteraceae bacterium]
MRRRGFPLLFPMGGFGMGMGMGGGGSLLGDLAAGGIGYLMGRQSAQQAPGQQYQAPQYQPPQTPQYQPPANQQAPAASGGNERLAQLQLLGHLRDSGLLTNDEFEAEKRKILQG